MSRFLITTWHLPGHVYPQMAIALALRARGHEVAFYSGAQSAKVIEGEGFRLFPFRQVDEANVDKVLLSPDRLSSEPTGGFSFASLLRQWMVETIPGQVADLEEVLNQWRPDAIACDQTMWGPTFILGELGRARVAITSCGACCMIPGPDAPPFGLGLRPPRTFPTRLAARAVTVAQTFVTGSFRRRLNEIRGQYSLPPIHTTALEHLGTVPLYIMPSTPEFDYDRHDLPASVRYVGPYLWNKPSTVVSPEWLHTLGHERPWVHATEGTIHVGEPLVLRATAQGLAGLEMEVIMTSGGARDPESINLGASAPNLHLTRWIAHSDLLPKTDVLITTGGAGTVLASIDARVPMILIPTEWDKPEIAQRIVECGAGIRIMPDKVTPKRIRAAAERILGDDSYKRGVGRLKEAFSRHRGAEEAAALLEEFAVSPQFVFAKANPISHLQE
jgi:MGT family glycosyltransferase